MGRPKRWVNVWVVGIVALLLAAGAFLWAQRKDGAPQANVVPLPAAGPLTFNHDVAPIVFAECAPCHRPGQAAPFNLLTYADVHKRARQIVEVTQSGYMPPWLPVAGHGRFANERRLDPHERETLARWAAEGAIEGNAANLPPLPEFSGEWRLGNPDLVVEMPAYTLPAEGEDLYRNLVAAIPVTETRYVRGVEFLPGNARVVHHSFINVDETGQSRRLSGKDGQPGFGGMSIPESAVMPGGQLLGWQPGKVPSFSPDGLAWVLKKGSDLVLQMHLVPTGKPELVQPRIGFYFTAQPPRNSAFRIKMAALNLDIPAGEARYTAEQTYTLPADIQLMRVGAHAHFLARDIRAEAILPSGAITPLLTITNWDFKWQGDYQYAQPVVLPQGTKIVARFIYDNSTNNVRNPHHPPRRVRYGLRTADEMGELFFQVVPVNPRNYAALAQDHSRYLVEVSADFFRHRLVLNPEDTEANGRLGRIQAAQGRFAEATALLKRAIQSDPNFAEAHLDLAQVYLRQKKHAEAFEEFQTVTRLKPEESQAFGSLGILALQAGRAQEAARYFQEAVRLNPEDSLAAKYLQQLSRGGAP